MGVARQVSQNSLRSGKGLQRHAEFIGATPNVSIPGVPSSEEIGGRLVRSSTGKMVPSFHR